MTTDNRTNEQLAERLRQFAESQAMDFDNPHIAMTLEEIADRLTGTITEAQVEAAAKAIWATRYPVSRPDIAEETWAEISGYGAWTPEALDIMTEARAALVAAQGVTSTAGIRALAEAEVRKSAAEGNPICEPGVTKDIAFIRGAVFGAAQGAAPVLPSSTVDEGSLSEAIEDAIIDSFLLTNTSGGFYLPNARVKDVADVSARAVVEAIGGEGK